jgi:hypothetical protein
VASGLRKKSCANKRWHDFAILKRRRVTIAFSSEAGIGFAPEKRVKIKNSASVLMQSEPNMR